jgi:hypothetical protein
MMPNVLCAAALAYRRAGCSLIPIAADGTKRPAAWLLPRVWDHSEQRWKPTWKPFQRRLPTEAELRYWFAQEPVGLAVIGGQISGGLEILDFDAAEVFEPWSALVDELAPGLLEPLPLVQTPTHGRHVYYRCSFIERNQKLAQRPNAEGRPEVMIETRGIGGYAIAPPSPPTCHPLQRPYRLLRPDLTAIPTITPDQRTILLNAARSFNEYVEVRHIISGGNSPCPSQAHGDRPGDIFNSQAQWPDILEPHGWMRVGQRGEITLWKRPGKRDRGYSATTNYADSEMLYVFSSNAWPFEPEKAYSKFVAYAWLEHGGDLTAAARALAVLGYGARMKLKHGNDQSDDWDGMITLPLRPYTGYCGYRGLRRG